MSTRAKSTRTAVSATPVVTRSAAMLDRKTAAATQSAAKAPKSKASAGASATAAAGDVKPTELFAMAARFALASKKFKSQHEQAAAAAEADAEADAAATATAASKHVSKKLAKAPKPAATASTSVRRKTDAKVNASAGTGDGDDGDSDAAVPAGAAAAAAAPSSAAVTIVADRIHASLRRLNASTGAASSVAATGDSKSSTSVPFAIATEYHWLVGELTKAQRAKKLTRPLATALPLAAPLTRAYELLHVLLRAVHPLAVKMDVAVLAACRDPFVVALEQPNADAALLSAVRDLDAIVRLVFNKFGGHASTSVSAAASGPASGVDSGAGSSSFFAPTLIDLTNVLLLPLLTAYNSTASGASAAAAPVRRVTESLLAYVLHIVEGIQRRHAKQRTVFEWMCQKLLIPLLTARSAVERSGTAAAAVATRAELVAAIDAVISGALFHTDHMNDFAQLLLDDTTLTELSGAAGSGSAVKGEADANPAAKKRRRGAAANEKSAESADGNGDTKTDSKSGDKKVSYQHRLFLQLADVLRVTAPDAALSTKRKRVDDAGDLDAAASVSGDAIRSCLPFLFESFLIGYRAFLAARQREANDRIDDSEWTAVALQAHAARQRRAAQIQADVEFGCFMRLHALAWLNAPTAATATEAETKTAKPAAIVVTPAPVSDAELGSRLQTAGLLYERLDRFSVYRINQPNGTDKFNALRSQLERVLAFAASPSAVAELSVTASICLCIEHLLLLNESLLEERLPRVWVFIWRSLHQPNGAGANENAANRHTAVRQLTVVLAHTFAKLRQFDVLLRSVFDAIPLCPSAIAIVPPHHLIPQEWSGWVRSVAPLQSPVLFDLFLTAIQSLSAPASKVLSRPTTTPVKASVLTEPRLVFRAQLCWIQLFIHFLAHTIVREPNAAQLHDLYLRAEQTLVAPALAPYLHGDVSALHGIDTVPPASPTLSPSSPSPASPTLGPTTIVVPSFVHPTRQAPASLHLLPLHWLLRCTVALGTLRMECSRWIVNFYRTLNQPVQPYFAATKTDQSGTELMAVITKVAHMSSIGSGGAPASPTTDSKHGLTSPSARTIRNQQLAQALRLCALQRIQSLHAHLAGWGLRAQYAAQLETAKRELTELSEFVLSSAPSAVVAPPPPADDATDGVPAVEPAVSPLAAIDLNQWRLVAARINLLAPYAAATHIHAFVRTLLTSLVESLSSGSSAAAIGAVSRSVLTRSSFYELHAVQHALVPVALGVAGQYITESSTAATASSGGLRYVERVICTLVGAADGVEVEKKSKKSKKSKKEGVSSGDAASLLSSLHALCQSTLTALATAAPAAAAPVSSKSKSTKSKAKAAPATVDGDDIALLHAAQLCHVLAALPIRGLSVVHRRCLLWSTVALETVLASALVRPGAAAARMDAAVIALHSVQLSVIQSLAASDVASAISGEILSWWLQSANATASASARVFEIRARLIHSAVRQLLDSKQAAASTVLESFVSSLISGLPQHSAGARREWWYTAIAATVNALTPPVVHLSYKQKLQTAAAATAGVKMSDEAPTDGAADADTTSEKEKKKKKKKSKSAESKSNDAEAEIDADDVSPAAEDEAERKAGAAEDTVCSLSPTLYAAVAKLEIAVQSLADQSAFVAGALTGAVLSAVGTLWSFHHQHRFHALHSGSAATAAAASAVPLSRGLPGWKHPGAFMTAAIEQLTAAATPAASIHHAWTIVHAICADYRHFSFPAVSGSSSSSSSGGEWLSTLVALVLHCRAASTTAAAGGDDDRWGRSFRALIERGTKPKQLNTILTACLSVLKPQSTASVASLSQQISAVNALRDVILHAHGSARVAIIQAQLPNCLWLLDSVLASATAAAASASDAGATVALRGALVHAVLQWMSVFVPRVQSYTLDARDLSFVLHAVCSATTLLLAAGSPASTAAAASITSSRKRDITGPVLHTNKPKSILEHAPKDNASASAAAAAAAASAVAEDELLGGGGDAETDLLTGISSSDETTATVDTTVSATAGSTGGWLDRVFVAVCDVLLSVVKYRAAVVTPQLPAVLSAINQLLSFLLRVTGEATSADATWRAANSFAAAAAASASASASAVASSIGEHCSERLARVLEEMAKPTHRKAFNKYAPYVLHDYIAASKKHVLSAGHKRALLPGIYALMTICSSHELEQVHTALDSAGRVIFKGLHSHYMRTYKFTGQV